MDYIHTGQWAHFSGSFNRAHDGWSASLRVRDASGRTETAIDDRPFRGLTFEQRPGRQRVILSFGDDADEHLAHIGENPRELMVSARFADHCSLVVGMADGSECLLDLSDPMAID